MESDHQQQQQYQHQQQLSINKTTRDKKNKDMTIKDKHQTARSTTATITMTTSTTITTSTTMFIRSIVRARMRMRTSTLVVVTLLILAFLLHNVNGYEHYYQRYYVHMFSKFDRGWEGRGCLMTMQGREYTGQLSTVVSDGEIVPCKRWEQVIKMTMQYDTKTKITNKNLPGLHSKFNTNYCRNPGGVFPSPGCFFDIPFDRNQEKERAASCQIPLCPVLKQFLSNPAGMEFKGLDLRRTTQCEDKCFYRHTLLGPACTLTFHNKETNVDWQVYYPCDVPLLEGDTFILKAEARGLPEDFNRFTPTTWLFTHGKTFKKPPNMLEGRMILKLPSIVQQYRKETTMRFHIRLADPLEVGEERFDVFLSPDTSFMETIIIAFDMEALFLTHRLTLTKNLTKREISFKKTEKSMFPWATFMYRWLDVHVIILDHTVQVQVLGSRDGKGSSNSVYQTPGIVQLEVKNTLIKPPKYVYMTTLRGSTMAVIETMNQQAFACTEGIVNLPKKSIKFYHWSIFPKVTPAIPVELREREYPNYKYNRFSDRRLRLQVFNAPFSIWLSSAPILQQDVKGTRNITHRKLNVVQILVGKHKIIITQCGVLESINTRKDIINCSPHAKHKFTTKLKKALIEGQEVVVDMASSEKSNGTSSMLIRIELHVNALEEYKYKLLHPIFPRYWTIIKSLHPSVFKKSDKKHLQVFFRILNNRCRRAQSFLQSEGCLLHKPGTKERSRVEKVPVPIPMFQLFPKLYQPAFQHRLDELSIRRQVKETLKHEYRWRKVRGPMYRESQDAMCISWNVVAFKKEHKKELSKIGNQCFNGPKGKRPFCMTDLKGTWSYCDMETCKEATTQCFDRADVQLTNKPFLRGSCIDSQEIMIVDVNKPASPANPLQLISGSKYDFEIKAWQYSRYVSLCIYLFSWNEMEVIFRITPREIAHSKMSKQIEMKTPMDTFLVPWRYVSYSFIETTDKWSLYMEEYAAPLLIYYTDKSLSWIGFDSCETYDNNKPSRYVLVRPRPQERTPTLQHFFKTNYFPIHENTKFTLQVPNLKSMLAITNLMQGHNTFFRVVGNQFNVWVKGSIKKADSGGGIIVFLMNQFTQNTDAPVMVYFDKRVLYIADIYNRKVQYVFIKKKMFPKYRVHLNITWTHIPERRLVKVHAILSTVEVWREVQLTKEVPEFLPLYAALTSYQAGTVLWSIGDVVPAEDATKKPVDGGWSKWMEKNCSNPCGGGIGFLERHCNNPTPSLLGRQCLGQREMQAPCNPRRCGALSKETEMAIRKRIIHKSAQKTVGPFLSVKLKCPRYYVNLVETEYPDTVFFWQHHSGRYFQNSTSVTGALKKKLGKIKLDFLIRHTYVDMHSSLVIEAAINQLTGLWLFVAETSPGVTTVVCVQPLLVTDQTDEGSQLAFEGDEKLLFCNAHGLSRFTGGNIKQTWYHNQKEYQYVNNVDSSRNDVLLIPKVGYKHHGVWVCVNTHMKSKTEYITAYVPLMVKEKPTFHVTHIFSKQLTGLMLASGVLLIAFMYNIVIATAARNFGRLNLQLKKDIKKLNADYSKAKKKKFGGRRREVSETTLIPHMLLQYHAPTPGATDTQCSVPGIAKHQGSGTNDVQRRVTRKKVTFNL